ncbi:MAG: hypothetical protein H7Y13_14080 [Sphingobacteriaceae bacterium]|nr:hypothetical protein [Sphingobacteriaceae bacterium]
MNVSYNIVDTPLPVNQDFEALKNEGLAFIQEHMGYEWNNLNPSDPGVTILDQVCFALTELGYCNDFSIADILTRADGYLQVDDQFYLPQEILTTNPVTIKDYIKCLTDGIDGVENAVILPFINTNINNNFSRIYQVYLQLNPALNKDIQDQLCTAVFYYLNKYRNLGELFFNPQPLTSVPYLVGGSIEIEKEGDLATVLVEIQNVIRSYIFPAVSASGYNELAEHGVDTNTIFNGPMLQQGWVAGDSLGEKRNSLRVYELIPLIEAVSGVTSVSLSGFYQSGSGATNITNEIKSGDPELLFIDVLNSSIQALTFISKGKRLSQPSPTTCSFILGRQAQPDSIALFGAKPDIYSTIPQGNYRDINTYYSIQNTFPAIFAVGEDSVSHTASKFQVAQSRQLKGYLSLFDQMLANQFSQLANIKQLFSFRNSVYGAPSDMETFMAFKDKFQRSHEVYPVPYRVFSPTYYYQSLYNVPHIRPLLKNDDTFKFSSEPEPEKTLEEQSWKDYQQDPYNAYMHGLMEFMEDEITALNRRNDILNHLLARHGESPLVMDAVIEGTIYSGSILKDKVIIKSLYLQNLGLLSYNRQKGYNYLGANQLSGSDSSALGVLPEVKNGFYESILDSDTIDSIFDSEKIDGIEKVRERDFINYSAIELKLSLLFGLKAHYINYLVTGFENLKAAVLSDIQSRQALWFLQKRRGLIMIEMTMLLNCFGFNVCLATNLQSGLYYQVAESLDYKSAFAVNTALSSESKESIDNYISSGSFSVNGLHYSLKQVPESLGQTADYKSISNTPYSVLLDIVPVEKKISYKDGSPYQTGIELFFPDFLPELTTEAFKRRLNTFLQADVPINLRYNYHFVSTELLESLIANFTLWHESMRYKHSDKPGNTDIRTQDQSALTAQYAKNLVETIQQIYNSEA